MLIGPGFEQLARADIQYSLLSTTDWASGNRTITYTYDDNGSIIQKVTKKTITQELVETITYTYNLQNRLARVTTTDHQTSTTTVVAYKYNPNGVRVAKIDDPDGAPTTTTYLIDAYNHTGYAQVFVEDDGTNRTSYIIGDDVLAQAKNDNNPQYLLYDGHGSTRQLIDSTGTPGGIVDSFSYDAYGIMLGGNPNRSTPAATSLLYAGEQFDTDAQQYYLRARYYDQNTGRFNRMDPFAGSPQDPQSLHKYLYCHNNPVNGIDPTGLFTIPSIVTRMAIVTVLTGIFNIAITGIGFYNLAKADFTPSGMMLNLSFATQGTSWGLTAAGTVSLFFHFSSRSTLLLFTPEAGFSPLSMFNTQRKLSFLMTGGFVFNADKATDVKGYNVTATWPWAMRNFVVPSPLRASPYYYAMMSYCNYLTGRWSGSKAAIQISQGRTVEFSAGRSYNFASTVGHTYELADLSKLPLKLGGAVGKIRNMFSSLNLQDAKTADKLIQMSDNLTSELGSD